MNAHSHKTKRVAARILHVVRLCACASVALVVLACSKQPAGTAAKGAPGAGGPPPALPVTVQRVELQRVPISMEAVGQAEGSREVEVRSRVSGIMEKRLYTEGSPVGANATLFVIERAPYEIAVAQARAALAQERAKQEQAQRDVERLKTLVQSRAIAQKEYDDAVSAVKQSAAAIQGAQAKVAEAQLNLSWTNVKAPIGGITGRATKSEGSLVTANTDLLTTLTQVNPVWVRFSLAESDHNRIRGAEKRARVNLLNEEGTIAADNGRLNFTGSTVDPKMGTVQLRAEFPNPSLKWRPGQFVKVQILAGEQEAFLVPQAAVVQTEQAKLVWVVDAEGKANMRPIQTANWIGSNWVVTSGLKPGDPVIVDNLIKLRPGAPVQPHAPGASPQPPSGSPSAAPVAADKKAAPAPNAPR
jgi:membrane fusion protein, multidrug efflux system